MLNERARAILSWVTIAVIVAVVGSGMMNILLMLLPGQETSSVQLFPAEVSLCSGQEAVFSIEPPLEDVDWAVTGGGEIVDGGRYVAGEPGDYEVQVAGPSGERGRALVHVLVCTPTPTPSPTSPPLPTPTPMPTPIPIADADPSGDVSVYSTGDPYPGATSSVDIRDASIAPDLIVSLEGARGLPAGLAEWAQEGEIVLWVALYGPAAGPTLPAATDWLFVLDLDGNTATGRPPGTRSVNPDLGDEVALGISYDPLTGSHTPFLWIWSSALGDWDMTDRSASVRVIVDENQNLIGVAVGRGYLEQQVSQYAGVTPVPGAVRGRIAAVTYTSPDALIDFYPNIP